MSEVSRSVRFAMALVLSLGVALAPWFYKLSFNLSESLPGSVYLVKRGAPAELRRGMLVEFQPARSVSARAFVKRITALPGDRIMRAGSGGREFWLAGSPNVFLGYAKRLSRKGAPLAPSQGGIVPAGYVYVSTEHQDSLDSRYRQIGLVLINRLTGTAWRLW